MKSAEQEIAELDAMLNSAIEAAGLDPATATADDLLAWIRERRAEDWKPIATAPKDGSHIDLWTGYRCPDCVPCGELWRGPSGFAFHPTHWRPIPEGPKA